MSVGEHDRRVLTVGNFLLRCEPSPARREAVTALDVLAAELAVVREERDRLRDALGAIQANAEAWHGPLIDTGHERSLAVIARWARDPNSIPEGVRAALSVSVPDGQAARGQQRLYGPLAETPDSDVRDYGDHPDSPGGPAETAAETE